MFKSIIEIELDTSEYNLTALNDVLRMLVIQLVVQILFVMKNNEIELCSQVFIENTLFILAGTMVYWLVFKHIINFTVKENDDKHIHYQEIYK
tara:strand:+ start:374 stop:652 length:279 start_codon:yes stop_codon:yes gene_type:complete